MVKLRSIHGTTVLVVDDSITIRRSAKIFLESTGCKVVLADDGFDGISKVFDCRPDIILCDIVMPRLDGYQLCALIKGNKHLPRIPVILLSSKDGLFDRVRGDLVGCNDYLIKPFTKSNLLSAVALNTITENT